MKAFHFTGNTLRDGREIPPIGVELRHEGEVKICASGLHASERLVDALRYAPVCATTLHVVECGEIVERHDDKFVCWSRTIRESHPLNLRAVVRLAIECAGLAAFCAGLDLPDLIAAAEFADRGDFDAAAVARAARAAADAAYAAVARAAADAAAARAYAARAAAAYAAAADAAAAADDAYAARVAAAYAVAAAARAARAADACAECTETRARALFACQH
jgi:hypothetical protein